MKHSWAWYVRRTSYYLVMCAFAVITIFPIYFALISSVKTNAEVFLTPFTPTMHPVFENFPRAIEIGNIGRSFVNTIWVTLAAVGVTLLASAFASYALSRFIFKSRGAVYGLIIAGMMVPMQTIIIPLSFYLGEFGMFDNYPVLILLFSAFQIPMTVFIVTGFMKSFPKEVEEAALIDGSGYFKTFFSIVLPLSAPALASASIFNFINIWNNLLFPLIFIRSQDKQLIALSLQAFFAERVSDYGGVMAAIVISILPTMLAYILLQEKVEKGLTAGAVKG